MTKEEAIKLIDDKMCFGRGKWSEHHISEIDDYWKAGSMAIKVLKEQPKTGKWDMRYDDDAPQDGIWLCSVCGYARLIDDISPQKYCPNCGAKMVKDDEE